MKYQPKSRSLMAPLLGPLLNKDPEDPRSLLSPLILLPLLFTSLDAFAITQSSSDIGQTADTPARSGDNAQSISLRCDLTFNEGEQWTFCQWSHSFSDIWVYDTNGFVMCGATPDVDQGGTCEDMGNLKQADQSYDPERNPWTAYDTDRLVYSVGQDYCGLQIQKPHANDSGVWTCHVNGNSPGRQSTTMWAEAELFVANISVVSVTKPSKDDNSEPGIEIDLSDNSGEVSAECTAEHGSPLPDIVWYVDESSNRLPSSLATQREHDGTVTSEIRFTLDAQFLSRYGVSLHNSFFSFSLGCLPDQGDYFEDQPDFVKNPAEVLVYGSSGAISVHKLAILTLLFGLLTTIFLI